MSSLNLFVPRQTIVNLANEKDPQKAMYKFMKRAKKQGFDQVQVEVAPHGYAMYKSKLLEEYPFLKDRDYKRKTAPDWNGAEEGNGSPFETAIKAAHENGLKASGWLWATLPYKKALNSKIGMPASFNGPNQGKISMYATSKLPNARFADPADPKTRKFLTDVAGEVMKHNPDELNLDYIRYNFGTPNPKPWAVNALVSDIEKKKNSIKPKMKLTATVFPFRNNSIAQNWEGWKDVDEFFLMNYTPGSFRSKNQQAKNRAKSANNKAPLNPLLSVEKAYNISPSDVNSMVKSLDPGQSFSIFSSLGLNSNPGIEKMVTKLNKERRS